MKNNKYILGITVFLSGAVVMIFELVGSRVLGPYFGTSIFVWTSLIGIILGSLSLGYYLGGKIADKRPSFNNLALVICISAAFVLITVLTKDFLLGFLRVNITEIRISSVLASIMLFLPASVFLGMVSPYAVKLKLNDLKSSGSTVGNLYALSTLGSIVGTFLAGFYLVPHFGTDNLLMILAMVLVLLALALFARELKKMKLFLGIVVVFGLVIIGGFNDSLKSSKFIDIDTTYNRIWIYDHVDYNSGEMVKIMGINNENHSSMFLESDELVNEYTKYYHLAKHFNPDFKSTLMFGGAGYSYPKDFLVKYPEATIDVVEIDPEVTELAKKYFRLKEDPRLTIHHEDGRVYLNRTEKKYDVIFGDAFTSRYSVPYQLTTIEAVKKEYEILNDDGIVLLNLISSMEGDRGQFLRAEYATYKAIFPQVYLFPVTDMENGDKVQNVLLVALKSDKEASFVSEDEIFSEYLQHLWLNDIPLDRPILTDDFAPVDYYIGKAI